MLFNTGKKFRNTTTAITKQDLTQTEEVINTNIVTKNNDLVNNSDANFLNVDGDSMLGPLGIGTGSQIQFSDSTFQTTAFSTELKNNLLVAFNKTTAMEYSNAANATIFSSSIQTPADAIEISSINMLPTTLSSIDSSILDLSSNIIINSSDIAQNKTDISLLKLSDISNSNIIVSIDLSINQIKGLIEIMQIDASNNLQLVQDQLDNDTAHLNKLDISANILQLKLHNQA